MFQLEWRYVVPQRGNTVRLLPSALPPRLTNEARGANRAAHERWDRAAPPPHPLSQTHVLYARPYAEERGDGKSSSALLFKQPSDSLPFLPSSPSRVPREQPAGYFSDKENRRAQQMHELKFFKSSSRLKDNKKRERWRREGEERGASARFSPRAAGTL